VLAMREWDLEFPFIEAIFTEYWELDNGDIGEYRELGRIAETLGVDAKRFEATAESQSVRQALIESTDQARAQGVFGAPSMMLEGELYWGKDRFEFIEDHLALLTTKKI
jgi:2-hydroxychromene-2-carboxylate isomerase